MNVVHPNTGFQTVLFTPQLTSVAQVEVSNAYRCLGISLLRGQLNHSAHLLTFLNLPRVHTPSTHADTWRYLSSEMLTSALLQIYPSMAWLCE